MNVKDILIPVLKTFGYPVYLQGSLNADEAYPETFITFWTEPTSDNAHFDDNVYSVDWSFSVIFYSNNSALVNSKPFEILEALRNAGFTPQGKGRDIPSDEQTHTGWAMDLLFTEENTF